MEFIDDPKFGHTKNRLPVFLVPVIMLATVVLGIVASKIYISSVLDGFLGNYWKHLFSSTIFLFNNIFFLNKWS